MSAGAQIGFMATSDIFINIGRLTRVPNLYFFLICYVEFPKILWLLNKIQFKFVYAFVTPFLEQMSLAASLKMFPVFLHDCMVLSKEYQFLQHEDHCTTGNDTIC